MYKEIQKKCKERKQKKDHKPFPLVHSCSKSLHFFSLSPVFSNTANRVLQHAAE